MCLKATGEVRLEAGAGAEKKLKHEFSFTKTSQYIIVVK